MKAQVNRTCSGCVFFALVAWASLPCIASCSSSDDAPAGGRLAHPPQPAPMPATSTARAQDVGLSAPEGSFSPLDEAIADDCLSLFPPDAGPATLPKIWSQNVPDRDCTKDAECGDGFCDRGHCAAIWTCGERYGQRCINGRTVRRPHILGDLCRGICLEGRCRFCESDAECVQEHGYPDARCVRSQERSQGRIYRIFVEGITNNRPIQ